MNLHTRVCWPRELFRWLMHNFHSFSRFRIWRDPWFPPFSLSLSADRWTRKNFQRISRTEKRKKKTDIKKYYSTDGARKIGCARRDKDLPRGKQKGERSDMYDGSWMLHDCLDHSCIVSQISILGLQVISISKILPSYYCSSPHSFSRPIISE